MCVHLLREANRMLHVEVKSHKTVPSHTAAPTASSPSTPARPGAAEPEQTAPALALEAPAPGGQVPASAASAPPPAGQVPASAAPALAPAAQAPAGQVVPGGWVARVVGRLPGVAVVVVLAGVAV